LRKTNTTNRSGWIASSFSTFGVTYFSRPVYSSAKTTTAGSPTATPRYSTRIPARATASQGSVDRNSPNDQTAAENPATLNGRAAFVSRCRQRTTPVTRAIRVATM